MAASRIELCKLRRNGATHLVITPVHYLAQIADLCPRPDVRYCALRGADERVSGE